MNLSDFSTGTLEALMRAAERGTLAPPFGELSLAAEGFGSSSSKLAAALRGASKDAVVSAVRAVLCERRRPSTRIDVVWTGPEAGVMTSRDTSIVVRELFESAERRIVIASYVVKYAKDILAPLCAAMQRRPLEVTLFLHLGPPPDPSVAPADAARAQIDDLFAKNWDPSTQRPEVYFWPETLGGKASLHAKCVVVDDRRALVTSANLTGRAHDRNIELGLLVDDPTLGARLTAQWNALASTGVVVRG